MHILSHAVHDTLPIVPFLYIVYLIINYLEGHSDNKIYRKMVNAKWEGPIIGSLLGCVPQCGFSVVGANLYSKRMIGVGTLIAIFLSTSDEAIPILLSHPSMIKTVGLVLVLKVIFAIIVGLFIEMIFKMGKAKKEKANISDKEVDATVGHGETTCGCCHHHEEKQANIWLHALKHTLKTVVFIFIINLVLGAILEGFGEAYLESVLLTDSIFQPALAALIGLIPNCVSSIILTEMFVSGALSLGSLIAGLCTGAGIGLVVLFKSNKNVMDNLKIIGILYLAGTLFGMILQFIG